MTAQPYALCDRVVAQYLRVALKRLETGGSMSLCIPKAITPAMDRAMLRAIRWGRLLEALDALAPIVPDVLWRWVWFKWFDADRAALKLLNEGRQAQ